MKVLIYGDPHVNKYPQGMVEQRRSTELDLFKYIYDEIVPKYHIDMCVCLGDFLHNSYLPASDMDYIYDLIKTITTTTVILTGNHDRSDDTNSTISLFDKLNDKITVIKESYQYIDDDSKVHIFAAYNYLKKLSKEYLKSADYLYTHEEYPGFVINTSGFKSTHGYKFDKFEVKESLIVFNGHIHHRGECTLKGIPDIVNVGAISPVAFGELELYDYPCVCILDTGTSEGEIVKITQPILPITCSEEQYNTVLSVYHDELSHVRLRVTYRDDIPQLEGVDQFLSVEYKKLIDSYIEGDGDLSTNVEDILVSVPQYVDEYLTNDKNLSDNERSEVKVLCDKILEKV